MQFSLHILWKNTIILWNRKIRRSFEIINRNLFQLNKWEIIINEITKAKMRNRYNQVPHLTLNSEHHMGTRQKITRKHPTQENQEVSSFSAGNHKAARSRQDSITK